MCGEQGSSVSVMTRLWLPSSDHGDLGTKIFLFVTVSKGVLLTTLSADANRSVKVQKEAINLYLVQVLKKTLNYTSTLINDISGLLLRIKAHVFVLSCYLFQVSKHDPYTLDIITNSAGIASLRRDLSLKKAKQPELILSQTNAVNTLTPYLVNT